MSNTPSFNDYELKIIKIIASGDFKLARQLAKSQEINITKIFTKLVKLEWIQSLPLSKTAFDAIEALLENNLNCYIKSIEHYHFLKMLNAEWLRIDNHTKSEDIHELFNILEIKELYITDLKTNIDCYLNSLKVSKLRINNSNIHFEIFENSFVTDLEYDGAFYPGYGERRVLNYKLKSFKFLERLPNLSTFRLLNNS